jgi:eukaryotic-like serine/threonine-protein kinase
MAYIRATRSTISQSETRTDLTRERFRQVRGLFEAALQIDSAERAAWLKEAAKDDSDLLLQVEQLLMADQLAGGDQALALSISVVRDEFASSSLDGQRVGQYPIIRKIGRGGMGTVYVARRSDDLFSKHVAVKVLAPERSSPELLRRFRQEREIVARLDHPNIARLLDGGTTEQGLPYSVMEYVEGQRIDAYCDERRLDVTRRLELFHHVCQAVQYAHQHLVIHRDLKPSNILVTADGTVKLLDFGIAKLMEVNSEMTLTEVGARVMTPAYASPEQARGEPISTSSDLYSLGVVLYELLTGRLPYRTQGAQLHEITQAICEQEPIRPSEIVTCRFENTTASDKAAAPTTEHLSELREGKPARLQRRLAGELDNIVLMALRKEPQRRYSSVEQFGGDIHRHLLGLPVLAQHDTLRYRTRKFVKRHRVSVLVAGVVMLMMSAAVGITTSQARVARQERARAEQQATEARFQSARATREAANALEQLRIAEQRTREAQMKDREAAMERQKASKRAQEAYDISRALLELNANLPSTAGENGKAVSDARRILNELMAEGFKAPGRKPTNLGFDQTK